MRPLDGWFILSQPKYKVPCIFDLHRRGLFNERPSVTGRCGARLLVNEQLRVAVEHRFLIEDRGVTNGLLHSHATRQGVFELGEDLTLDLTALHEKVADEETVQEISRVYSQWFRDYLPLDGEGEDRQIGTGTQVAQRTCRSEKTDPGRIKEKKRRLGNKRSGYADRRLLRMARWQDNSGFVPFL